MFTNTRKFRLLGTIFVLFIWSAVSISAQTTAFTYQGRLSDGSAAANGAYDLQFALYDAPAAGNQVGASQEQTGASIANGVFTVQLDFGSSAFSGADRYLEIRVKKPADASYTTLNPRQKITSVPYAIRSLNSSNVETTAGNSVVDSINNQATNTTINSDRLAADVVRLKPAASQTSTTFAGDLPLLDLTGAVTDGSNNPPQTVRFRLDHDGAFGIFKNADSSDPIIKLNANAGFLVRGAFDGDVSGTGVPIEGAGTRLMWYPGKAAFRAGVINGTQWDAANIGNASTAFGQDVRASGDYSFAAGKSSTAANVGTIALGEGNVATGANSIALGYRASTSTSAGSPRTGSFVFSDRSDTSGDSFHAQVTNGAHWRVANGFRIFTSSNLSSGVTFQNGSTPSNWGQANAVISTSTGAYLSTSGIWTNVSSRKAKTNFTPIDSRFILQKVLDLPITTWNYKVDSVDVRHIGAMAQDFYKAFKVGADDEHITPVDTAGVAFAAIQGLNEEMNERAAKLEAQNAALRRQVAAQKAQFAALEERLKRLERVAPARRAARRRK